jgi:hypothetical protein
MSEKRRRWQFDLKVEFFWWLQTLSQELRSLYGRIGVLRERKTGLHPSDLGTLYRETPSGHLSLSARTAARTASIRNIFAKYRWAGAADVMLVLEGWEMGNRFALCTSDSRDMEREMASDPYADCINPSSIDSSSQYSH